MKHPKYLSRRPGKYLWTASVSLFIIPGLATLLMTPAQAAPANPSSTQLKPSKSLASLDHEEQVDRAVDSASLVSAESAIAKLRVRIRQAQNTPQEPVMLSRLADLQGKLAESIFRVEHGKAHSQSQQIDLTRYNGLLREMISTLTSLITRYPHFKEVKLAYFARAKAMREVGDTKGALREWDDFTARFPGSAESVPAHIYASEIAMETGEYATAIGHLEKSMPPTTNPHYPFVQEKLSSAYFNTNQYAKAIQHTEALIAFYRRKLEGARAQKQTGSNYQNQIETQLQNVTLFFATGVVTKTQGFSFETSLGQLRRVEQGPYLGKMCHQFSIILRAKGSEAELISWKDQVLAHYPHDAETGSILFNTYEAIINWKKYDLLASLPRDVQLITRGDAKALQSLNDSANFKKLKNVLIESAEKIFATLGKKPTLADHLSVSPALQSLLTSYLQVTDAKDPVRVKVRYRLAEHYFSCLTYKRATAYYAWVAQGRDNLPVPPELMKLAQLKAIASRFEELREAKLIPESLQPRALSTSQDKLPALLTEWVKWVDESRYKDSANFESFQYQAIRALYAQGSTQNALARMIDFIESKPKSEFAPALASLATDTTIVSQDWIKTYEIANRFLKLKTWDAKFIEKLNLVASDSYFKTVELAYNSKDYDQSFKKGQEYLTLYPNSKHYNLCLGIVGSSALSQQKPEVALPYFETLIQRDPKSIHVANALITRASQSEQKFQFSTASKDYQKFMALAPENATLELKRKILLLSFLSEDASDYRALMNSKSICSGELAVECDRYEALILLQNDKSQKNTVSLLKKAKTGHPENKVFWMTLALNGDTPLSAADQLLALNTLIAELDKQDGLYRLAMVQSVVHSVPKIFKAERKNLSKTQVLSAKPELMEKSIKKRLEAVTAFENLATQAMSLGFVRLRAQILNEVAGLYSDFSDQIKGLKAPKGFTAEDKTLFEEVLKKLSAPFDEKKKDLRLKAFELASQQAVENEVFTEIAKSWEKDFPLEAEKLTPVAPPSNDPNLSIKLITQVDPASEWQMPSDKIQSKWYASIRNRQWARVAFFANQAKLGTSGVKVSEGMQLVAKAVSLAAVGAQSEGLAELKEAYKKLPSDTKGWASLALMNHFFLSYDSKETRKWLEEAFESISSHEDEFFKAPETVFSVFAASIWSGFKLDSSFEQKARSVLGASQQFGTSPWLTQTRAPASGTTGSAGGNAPAAEPVAVPEQSKVENSK
ncbi:MAG: hypothetical protein H7222_18055 [Methylotenera sp.]|nr:hypothetical protein [Oligoflexia bacterium]